MRRMDWRGHPLGAPTEWPQSLRSMVSACLNSPVLGTVLWGPDLRMLYNSDGIRLTGRYTLTSGEMKYSLPVIPLKTFTIQDGSYVEFTGDPMNPTLNITATERNPSSAVMPRTRPLFARDFFVLP